VQPALEVLQSADVVETEVDSYELEQTGLTHGLLLLVEDDVDVLVGQHAIVGHRTGKRIGRLMQRQSERRLSQPLSAEVINLDPDPPACRVG
jgi:hypothetical protein